MKNQKGFSILIGVLIIIFFAILAVIGYLVYKQFNTPRGTSDTKNTQNETANWETYGNSKYGFEIKYPSNWKFSENPSGEPRFSFYKEGEIPYVPTHANITQVSIFPNGLGTEGPLDDPIKVDKDLTEASEKVVFEYHLANNNQIRGYGIYLNNTPTTWDVKTGFIWAEVKAENMKVESVSSFPRVQISGDTNSEDLNTILKILSTFKFIHSPTQTSGWKTYTNAQYGFEIKYPEKTEVKVSDEIVKDTALGTINRGKKIGFNIDSSKFLYIKVLNKNPQCPDTTATGDLPSKTIGGINFMGITGHQIGQEIHDQSNPPYTQANEYCALVKGLKYKIISAIDYYPNTTSATNPETDIVLNQMLSSFKFTK